MKSTYMVYAILLFGVIVAVCSPHLVTMALRDDSSTYESVEQTQTTTTQYDPGVAVAVPTASEKVTVTKEEVKKEQPEEKKEVVQEPLEEEKNVPTQEQLQAPIIYDGMTLEQLTAKLNNVLHSSLSNTGSYFAKYAIDNGVDPYVAVGITLLETGCHTSCSNAVKSYNNVGGMKSGGHLIKFSSIEEGISRYILNLKKNYYAKGLTTLEQINKRYAPGNTAWTGKVNRYINMIKAS